MKRLILSALVACILWPVLALTVDDLFGKYKVVEDAQYSVICGDELRAAADTVKSETDRLILKRISKMESLMISLEAEQREQLADDLNALKGYSLQQSFTMNETPVDSLNKLGLLISMAINPTVSVEVYSQDVDDDCLVQPIIVFDMFGITSVSYLDGKLPLDELDKTIHLSFNSDVDVVDDEDLGDEDIDIDLEDDSDAVDMSNLAAMIRQGHYLVAIDGVLHPEIKNSSEAAKYMVENSISCCIEEHVIGRDNIATLYPGTEADLVINYKTTK